MPATLAAFDGPIIVCSGYEWTRLTELAGQFHDLSAGLNGVIARLVDLLRIVRGAACFAEFRFRNSIKSVARRSALDLAATILRASLMAPRQQRDSCSWPPGAVTERAEADQLRATLSAYCQRATLALVAVHRALAELACQ